jgi:hypothetical protein
MGCEAVIASEHYLDITTESQGAIIPQMASNEHCDRTLMLPGSTTTHEQEPAFLRA